MLNHQLVESYPFMAIQENQRKIAFVGTFCSGKTTMLNGYKERMQGDQRFAFVEEAARKFFEEHPFIQDRSSMSVSRRLQNDTLKSEKRAHATGAEIILCDSSTLTAVMYTRGLGQRRRSSELLQSVEFWLPTYERFLLLNPADIPFTHDIIRQESEAQRQTTHEAYVELFAEKHIPYELISGTLPERFKRVDEILQQRACCLT